MVVRASRLAAESLRLLPRKSLSRLMGHLAEAALPGPILHQAVAAFVRAYDVDLSDIEEPSGGWTSFDAFFTRPLRPGSRPIDPDPNVLVSPADGRLDDIGAIDQSCSLGVKGRRYTVAQLLTSDEAATRYRGGMYAIVYLAPPDYHRVHAPVAGRISSVQHIPGTLFPVNRIGLDHIPNLFVRNERVVFTQESATHGEVTTIMIGAIGVGRIEVAFDDVMTNRGKTVGMIRRYENGVVLSRGTEIGTFHLGSTAVVLVARGRTMKPLGQPREAVRMGSGIAIAV